MKNWHALGLLVLLLLAAQLAWALTSKGII